jgi:hypothetical protein
MQRQVASGMEEKFFTAGLHGILLFFIAGKEGRVCRVNEHNMLMISHSFNRL